jgi:hypothetical protein
MFIVDAFVNHTAYYKTALVWKFLQNMEICVLCLCNHWRFKTSNLSRIPNQDNFLSEFVWMLLILKDILYATLPQKIGNQPGS